MADLAITLSWGFALLDLGVLVLAVWTVCRVPYAEFALAVVAGLIFLAQMASIVLEAVWHMPCAAVLAMDLVLTAAVLRIWWLRPAMWSAMCVAALAAQVGAHIANRFSDPTDFAAYVVYIGILDVLFVAQLMAVAAPCIALLVRYKPRRR